MQIMILRALLAVILVQFLTVTAVHNVLAVESDPAAADGEFPIKLREFTGDLDEMAKDRVIRVLMPYSRTFYFFDGAQPRGASYDLIKLFENFINEK